ncbi:MAG TPA: DNA-directed RNA polymerase subunit omega [Tichowtungia sp.]|nr:DNA-directed RNA polymerase subunit omega [Tichowtungia sp.]
MARITVEDCLDVVPNRFLLAMVAAKRSKQLFKGAQPLIENKSNNRKVVLALREIAAEKIAFEIPVRQQD